MKKRSYSIGLDIGVASVGWACLTSDFRIPKFNGRYAIGVREFDSAETAETRRIQRGTRRRYNRRRKRIQLLQQLMSPLFENDQDFFMTDEGKHFWRHSNQFKNKTLSETLRSINQNSRKYPTIYHLRHALMTKQEKFHPRLIYLAIHHLVKFRGHFLNEGLSWADTHHQMNDLIKMFFEELVHFNYDIQHITEENYEKLIKILENDFLTNADKRTKILRVIGREFRQPVNLILGLRTNVQQMFPHSENIDLYKEENLRVSFNEDDIEEFLDKLTDQEKVVFEHGQAIYQSVLLRDLLGDANYVSAAKVKEYDQFGEDLKTLKKIYNNYLTEKEYRQMFITSRSNLNEYHQTRKKDLLSTFDQFLRIHQTERPFYREIRRILEDIIKNEQLNQSQTKEIEQILDRIKQDQFLRKQRSHLNAAIPHQNNVYEAENILKNQQKFHSQITDEMIERVKQIISFRIPYYIGPLVKNNENAKFGWATRKRKGRIKPWTIDQIIDHSQSAELFISRMTNHCAYLTDEKVLPKHSLTYQLFEVLNELNGIQIRTSQELPHRKYRLDKNTKWWLIEKVFMKYKNVTNHRIVEELKKSPYKNTIIDRQTNYEKSIFGTQKEDRFSTSLSTFIDMKNIFGEINEHNWEMIEEIIYWITVFEEKDILEYKIKEKYNELTDEQIRRLIHLNYAGWGRLSHKLLDQLPVDQTNQLTFLDIMKNESKVFMEVLSIEKYNLDERIKQMNRSTDKHLKKITYRDIEELQGSPALKKGIWQAVLLIEELVEIFGEPEHIMIEFARDDQLKQRTKSRKDKIIERMKAITSDEVELKQFLKDHSQYDEAKYQDQRFYLYITQHGKCLYSGETLDVKRLQDYEIDHILPRNYVEDNSVDNLALVTQRMNQKKSSDKMPLEIIDIKDRQKQIMFWKKLLKNNLITQSKYYRLMKKSFSDQDKESFFARQLVETRQISKHVKDLLEERFEFTEIHPVNANIITNLRQHAKVMKIRDLNNKHHAIDAVFANLVIQYILKKYGHNFLKFDFRYQEAREKWRSMLSQYRKNFFLFSDLIDDDIFTHYQTGEIINGYQFLHMLNNEVPWQTTKKVGSNESAFYDETIYSPKVRKANYQSGKLDIGVHSDLKVHTSYLVSYKYLDKQKREKLNSDIINLLVIEKYQNPKLKNKELAMFLANKVANGKVIDAIIHTEIPKYQKILIDDHMFYFVSEREMHNAEQFQPQEASLKKYNETERLIKQNKTVSVKTLKNTFELLAKDALKQFSNHLPESRIENIKTYVDEITDIQSYVKGISELFRMASASASRSTIFGGRYNRKVNPNKTGIVHESITGLRYRKPKFYKHELWST